MSQHRQNRRHDAGARERRTSLAAPNESWSLSFTPARMLGGSGLRLLLIVDDYTGHSPSLSVREQFSSWDVVEALNDGTRRCGLPRRLRLDADEEFGSPELSVWAQVHCIRMLHPAAADSLVTSPAMAALLDAVRLCLNQRRLFSVPHAQQTLEAWRRRYNGQGEDESECGGGVRRIPREMVTRPVEGRTADDSVRDADEASALQFDWPNSRRRD